MLLRLIAVLCTAVFFATSSTGARAATVRLHLGDKAVFSGRTATKRGTGSSTRATGRVYVTATWNGHARYVVAVPRTDRMGRYRAAFRPSHRGTYHVRILTPDTYVTDYTVDVS